MKASNDYETAKAKENPFYRFYILFLNFSHTAFEYPDEEQLVEARNILSIQKKIIEGLFSIFREILKIKYKNFKNGTNLKYNRRLSNYIDTPDLLKLLRRFPRAYAPGKIIVAARICASCRAPSPTKQCSCPCAAPYCGKNCQAEHHK